MKYLFFFLFLFFSCGSQHGSATKNEISLNSVVCPDDGVCSLNVLPNQSFSIEKDGIGVLYPKIKEGQTVLLKFEYKRNEIPNTVDGNYSEIIYLELDPNNLEFENDDVKNIKALFGRLCFCRGQTGYYIINQGELSIMKISKNQYRIKMNFKVDEVPQVVTTIDEVFSIK
ncbi:hypothetical protein ACFS5M_02790 [Lacinutrix iliipiscaria]|uniref:Gliding motility-associated lipoprotein GldH n=1 Tax=Lacinutrix iliipiscaria TaxID=1230532 RepID=A0ABW5WMT9_9FLAO